MSENYKKIQHKTCEFYPCHQGVAPEDYNCLFCYCPLYALGDQCGGNVHYTANGIKDCSACIVPHGKDSYDRIMAKMGHVMALAKKDMK